MFCHVPLTVLVSLMLSYTIVSVAAKQLSWKDLSKETCSKLRRLSARRPGRREFGCFCVCWCQCVCSFICWNFIISFYMCVVSVT